MITAPLPRATSPFDQLRHEDEHGEHWLAREPTYGPTITRSSWTGLGCQLTAARASDENEHEPHRTARAPCHR